MSRFVRASKYRHVFGQPAKKEHGVENVKVTNSAWDTNFISASAKYLSINWNASGGGAFAIIPLLSPFHPPSTTSNSFPQKLPDTLPLARSHTAAVLDTDWSPHNDSLVASGGDDGALLLWKVDPSHFENWAAEGWVPHDFDPVLRIGASARRVGQVLFHPTASNVLASATGEQVVKLWDLAYPEDARVTLSGHGDAIQCLAFNPTGTLLATTCRDRKLRLFDPRVGGDPVRVADGHAGIKGSRVVFMGDLDRMATTGFSRMSDRQVAIWETGGLGNLKTVSLDQSSGVVMPFWSDNNILFLAGKGDGNIRYYEIESDTLHPLSEYKSSDPQRGMCFLPRRALNVTDCEIARAYKLHSASIEPIAFIVPRKAETFQSDIFPPAPSDEPSVSAAEFFSGKGGGVVVRNVVDLSFEGGVVSGSGGGSSGGVMTASPLPAVVLSPAVPSQSGGGTTVSRSNSFNAGSAASSSSPVLSRKAAAESTETSLSSLSLSTQVPPSPSPSPSLSSTATGTATTTAAVKTTITRSMTSPLDQSGHNNNNNSGDSALKEENARLTAELREAREKIRNLELQVESMRANVRKAAQQLLGA